MDALQTFAVTKPRFLLVGSYIAGENRRIEAGEYFPIDLRMPPFSLTEGIVRSYEEHTNEFRPSERDKQLLLVDGEFLEEIDFHQMKKGCAALPVGELPRETEAVEPHEITPEGQIE